MKKKNRYFLFAGFLGLLVCLGGYYAVEHVFPYMGIKPWRMEPAKNTWKFPKGYQPHDFGLTAEKLQIRTPDQLQLSAWLVPSKLDTTYATIVLLHGISNCKETNFPRAALLADSGYASLLLDLRAHGESEGEYCTFGFREKFDLSAAADSIAARYKNHPIGIWGASLGGAVALQTMAQDQRYTFGIVESTFDEFPKVAAEYGADYMLGWRSEWVIHRVIQKSGAIAGFDPYAVKPVEAARQIHRPVLFMHGDKDARIPPEFNKRNYEALDHPMKQWISVANAGHNNLWDKDGDRLKKAVWHFLRQIQSPSSQ